MSRRTQRRAIPQRQARRPVNKELINSNLTAIVAAQQATTLRTMTFPATVTGLRWDLTMYRSAGTTGNAALMVWAIILLPENQNASTLSLTNAASLYQPEQHVLAFGSFASDTVAAAGSPAHLVHMAGSSKTMRKLRSGDRLQLIAFGTATEAHDLFGTIQWFEKT